MLNTPVDRYILEVVWKAEYESFVDEFDGCADKFELVWKDSGEEDEYLYSRR
jgi:hypothetical protein